MAIGDIYQLTLFGRILGQQTVNVFFYEALAVGAGLNDPADNLAQAFYTEMFGDANKFLRSTVMSSLASYNEVRVVNLFNELDFSSLAFTGIQGGTVGETLPAFAAYAFRTSWLGPAVRRGMKRFAGVLEANSQNGAVPAAVIDASEDFRQSLQETLILSGDTFRPVVVKRIKVPDPDSKSGFKYVLPENQAQADVFAAVGWEMVNQVTTQNSRKIGKGS